MVGEDSLIIRVGMAEGGEAGILVALLVHTT